LLQQELEETERQLSQLQSQQGENGALVVSPEQQAAIDEFVEKRIDIRKALRNVQHQLDKDINKLGSQLKFVNIAVSPLMLVFGLFLLFRIFQRRSFRGY
jgi:predicted mannosyl-3-phosphoglycerate phosphatase (HAD superfamily)